MYTEDKAMQMICPQTMHLSQPQGCCASGCMAWRWDKDQPAGEYDSSYHTKNLKNRRGYCGLGGKP